MNKIILKNIDINDILHKNDNLLTIKELLTKIKYDINNIYIDQFWDNISDDKWIYIDNELILWLDYKDINKGKEKIIKFLKSNFILEDDYKILSNVEYNNSTKNNYSFCSPAAGKQNINEEKRGAHNKQYIIISPDCFKELCMLVGTLKSKEIKKYYIELEKIFKFYLQYQARYQELKNLETQEKLENKNAELEKNKQNTMIITENMILSYNGKSVVYVAIIGENKIKFGITNKIIERVKQHKKNFERFEIVYISICLNNLEIESLLKDYAKENNKLRNQVINDHNYTELIDINENFTIEMVINKINENCQIQYDYRTLLDKYNTLQGYNEELQDKIKQLEITNIHQISKLKNENEYLKNKNIEFTTNQQSTDKTEKRYKCTKCNIFTCNKKRDLIEHENRVNKCDEVRKVKTYNCYKCNKEFKKPSTLEEHINRKSSCDIVLKCNKCNKIFTLLYNYNQHINRLKSCV